MQIFELDGYFRAAHGLHPQVRTWARATPRSTPAATSATAACRPFPCPLECWSPSDPGRCSPRCDRTPQQPAGACAHKNIGGANLRLRLEPTINVTDQVRVTPRSTSSTTPSWARRPTRWSRLNRPAATASDAPGGAASALYTTQDPPEVGTNSFVSSIRAKRAWGEVDSEFGSLRFGRMPWHFGRGMAFNNGACPDCDGGTTVDRVMASDPALRPPDRGRPGTSAPQGPTYAAADAGPHDPSGYPVRPVAGATTSSS